MQHQLGLIDQQELARVLDVLPQPLAEVRGVSDTEVFAISLGPANSGWSLTGACVINRRPAPTDPRLSVSGEPSRAGNGVTHRLRPRSTTQ